MKLELGGTQLARRDRETNSEIVLGVVLNPEQENQYRVLSKPYPLYLPEAFEKTRILWLTCFGIYDLQSEQFIQGEVENGEYQVELDPVWFERDNRLFIFDGNNVLPLEVRFEDGKAIADLALGDPPIGVAF